MANAISPYSEGRQPCRTLQEDRLNGARTCPGCSAMVQWCRNCGRTHHAGNVPGREEVRSRSTPGLSPQGGGRFSRRWRASAQYS
jgi:hypothetical protein